MEQLWNLRGRRSTRRSVQFRCSGTCHGMTFFSAISERLHGIFHPGTDCINLLTVAFQWTLDRMPLKSELYSDSARMKQSRLQPCSCFAFTFC